jgi:hypothetical protein
MTGIVDHREPRMSYARGDAAPYAPRRRRRWPLRLLIALIVLVLLVVAADRVALLVAERLAGDAFQQSQDLPGRPSVSIAGFPFLTQVASGDYDDVRVDAKGLVVGQAEHPLRLADLKVDLHQVVVTNSFHDFHARTGSAAATVSYAELSKTLGAQISYAGSGRIRAAKTIAAQGRSVPATASAVVTASSATGLTFHNVQVDVAGFPLPADVTDSFHRTFTIPIPLGNLPFGITVQRVDTTAAGIVIHLLGHDLSYSRA